MTKYAALLAAAQAAIDQEDCDRFTQRDDAQAVIALLAERERLREALKQSNAALMEEERLSYAADGYGYKECDYSDAVVVARAALALGEQNG